MKLEDQFFLSLGACAHEAASQRCFSAIMHVKRLAPSISVDVSLYVLVGAQKRPSLATTRFAAEGVVCEGGVKALERDVLARCVYPDTEQKHTYTPESEPSDGLLQGPSPRVPGYTSVCLHCSAERETPVSHRPDKQPSVPARWLCSSFC